MDLLGRMNCALDYIEEKLADEVDLNKIAQTVCCSANHFQRMFSFITGISLTEYIRRRRLTAAGLELQKSNIKVIDLALKYGYNSPDAFSRAFEKMHGVTPTEARESGVVLKSYPKMIFYISIKGDVGMDYRIVEKEAFELVGKGVMVNMDNVGQKAGEFWRQCDKDGTCRRLMEMSGGELFYGVTCYSYGRNDTWSYHIACDNKNNLEKVEELDILRVPAHTWVVFQSSAPLNEAIKELWGKAYSEWLPSSGYTALNGPEMEVYHQDRVELWIPIK
jgi:AraC-type DNA-binding domain-containing proteins